MNIKLISKYNERLLIKKICFLNGKHGSISIIFGTSDALIVVDK